MKRILTVLGLALVFVVAGMSGTSHAGKPSERTMNFAHDAAQTYWTNHGYETCPGKPYVYFRYRYKPRADWLMWAYIGGDPRCLVTVNTSINWTRLANHYGVYPATIVCAVVVHEEGHLAGLEHTYRGIMRGDSYIVIPRVCRY